MDNLVEIGYILKTHGYKGDVRVRFHKGIQLVQSLPEVFFVKFREEILPFFTMSLKNLTEVEALIRFEGMDNKEEAQKLKGSTLYLHKDEVEINEAADNSAEDKEALIGYAVEDLTIGAIGTVEDVLAYPQQDLLAVKYNGRQVLIPLRPEIVRELDDKNKRIICDLPEGLLDI